MKKILIAITAVIISMTASAQGIEIYKNGKVVAGYTGSDYKVVVKKTPAAPVGGHDYVEISGLKWATMNVGATTVASSEETSYGNYYQWASTNHWMTSVTYPDTWGTTATQTNFIDGNTTGYTSSTDPNNSSYTPSTSGTGRCLNYTHDVAHAAWGGSWRMPSAEEFKALGDACGGASDAQNSAFTGSAITTGGIYWINPEKGSSVTIDNVEYKVPGRLFVTTADATKRVFFPAAGSIDDKSLNAGTYGYYWSSSLKEENTSSAYCIYFSNSSVNPQKYNSRYFGFPVRPVSE